jgi:hypothetical protein
MAGVVGAWPVDSADGLRPTSLPTGASTAEGSSICFMADIIVLVSPRTNGCPEKPGAAQEKENAKLKKLLAEAMLDIAVLKDISTKKW